MNEEYHYAPMTGGLMWVRDGIHQPQRDWAEKTIQLQRFLELRRNEKLVHADTINFGHDLFHGHAGQVLVYRVK